MTKVEFVDQTLRDGQQSLWGMRLRAYQAADALPHLAKTGFRTIDLTGAGMFTVLLRQFRDDPWASTDFLVKGLAGNELRSGLRTISVIGFAHTPDSIIDLWCQTLVKHGVTSMWMYDCLYDMPVMERLVRVFAEAGGRPVPAVMYGLTGVHDDEFFASRAGQMATWPGVESVYVEDAAGVLTPERARTLLPAVRKATGSIPLELHCHNTAGVAEHNYIEGLKAGFTRLHTASRPMANGPSLPSTESLVNIAEALGFEHGLDASQFDPVAENFMWAAQDAGFEPGRPVEHDPRIYDHQIPGGMMGTFLNQLAQHGMQDRLPAVLAEVPRVREELGHPIMATPFSQFVGTQAVLNVITGKRYSIVPDEVIHYALGHYGPLPRPLDPEVLSLVLAIPRAQELTSWVRPQPSLAEIRKRFPAGTSDEELLLRFMTSDEEVDRMLAAGPIRIDPRRATSEVVRNVQSLVSETRGLSALSVRTPDVTIDLARRG